MCIRDRDITDPETIDKFTQNVGQAEKLDYLYLLTVNDIRATNPALWNGWKHQLLKDLYLLTRSKINKEPMKVSSEIAKDRNAPPKKQKGVFDMQKTATYTEGDNT